MTAFDSELRALLDTLGLAPGVAPRSTPAGLDAADLAIVDQHAGVVGSCRNALVEDVQRELFSSGEVWLSSPEVQATASMRLPEVTQLLAEGRAPAGIAPWMAGGALFPGAKKGDGARA